MTLKYTKLNRVPRAQYVDIEYFNVRIPDGYVVSTREPLVQRENLKDNEVNDLLKLYTIYDDKQRPKTANRSVQGDHTVAHKLILELMYTDKEYKTAFQIYSDAVFSIDTILPLLLTDESNQKKPTNAIFLLNELKDNLIKKVKRHTTHNYTSSSNFLKYYYFNLYTDIFNKLSSSLKEEVFDSINEKVGNKTRAELEKMAPLNFEEMMTAYKKAVIDMSNYVQDLYENRKKSIYAKKRKSISKLYPEFMNICNSVLDSKYDIMQNEVVEECLTAMNKAVAIYSNSSVATVVVNKQVSASTSEGGYIRSRMSKLSSKLLELRTSEFVDISDSIDEMFENNPHTCILPNKREIKITTFDLAEWAFQLFYFPYLDDIKNIVPSDDIKKSNELYTEAVKSKAEIDNELKKLKKQLNKYKKDKGCKESELSLIDDDIENARAKIKRYKEKKKNTNSKSKKTSYDESIDNYNDNKKTLKKNKSSIENKIGEIDKEIEDMQSKINEKTINFNKFKSVIDANSVYAKSYSKKIKNIENDVEVLMSRIGSFLLAFYQQLSTSVNRNINLTDAKKMHLYNTLNENYDEFVNDFCKLYFYKLGRKNAHIHYDYFVLVNAHCAARSIDSDPDDFLSKNICAQFKFDASKQKIAVSIKLDTDDDCSSIGSAVGKSPSRKKIRSETSRNTNRPPELSSHFINSTNKTKDINRVLF